MNKFYVLTDPLDHGSEYESLEAAMEECNQLQKNGYPGTRILLPPSHTGLPPQTIEALFQTDEYHWTVVVEEEGFPRYDVAEYELYSDAVERWKRLDRGGLHCRIIKGKRRTNVEFQPTRSGP